MQGIRTNEWDFLTGYSNISRKLKPLMNLHEVLTLL